MRISYLILVLVLKVIIISKSNSLSEKQSGISLSKSERGDSGVIVLPPGKYAFPQLHKATQKSP